MNPILSLIDRAARWRNRLPHVVQPIMAEADRQIIRRFAEGETALREQAISIHRQYIPLVGVRGTPEQDFMAEVDNAAPDLGLRTMYRNRLLTSDALNPRMSMVETDAARATLPNLFNP
jgi:hypothetical protein